MIEQNAETINYQSMSKPQKDMVDAIQKIGFKYKFNSIYEKNGWGEINLKKVKNWSELIEIVFKMGNEA